MCFEGEWWFIEMEDKEEMNSGYGLSLKLFLGQFYNNTQTMSQFDYLLKLIVVGDTGVGKSCVVMQFMERKMIQGHQVTLGVQFASRMLTLPNNHKNVKLQVWDTAGQENFRSITRSYYRSAVGALLVYDITKRRSFEHLQGWLKQIRNNGTEELQILLIGNKNDLQDQREVQANQGRQFAQDQGIQWCQTSAKEYNKVEAAFVKLTKLITGKIERGEIGENTPGVKISQNQKIDPLFDYNQNKKRCC